MLRLIFPSLESGPEIPSVTNPHFCVILSARLDWQDEVRKANAKYASRLCKNFSEARSPFLGGQINIINPNIIRIRRLPFVFLDCGLSLAQDCIIADDGVDREYYF
jgi:hypothetical protein